LLGVDILTGEGPLGSTFPQDVVPLWTQLLTPIDMLSHLRSLSLTCSSNRSRKTSCAGLIILRASSTVTHTSLSISGNWRPYRVKVPGFRVAGSKAASTAQATITFFDLSVVSPSGTHPPGEMFHPVSSSNSL